MSPRAFACLRNKLEKAELAHLRDLCLSLHEELEQTRQSADFWHDYAMELMEELWQSTDKTVGITKEGQISIINKEAA